MESFKNEFYIKNIFDIYLYVDEENKFKILEFIKENKDRFRSAIYVLLKGGYNNELYGKESISNKTKYITAFKFKKRKNSNYRIYCKEHIDESTPNIKKVVMITVHNKKTQKIDKRIKSILERISKYNYEI